MHELFDHTADLGLRVRAPDLDTLFREAAAGLVSSMVENPSAIQPVTVHRLELSGIDREYLLFDFLREILFRFEAEHWLLADCEVVVRDQGLTATLRGEPLDRQRHTLSHEVKAITYHELLVEHTPDGWLAEVIVDI